MRSACVVLLVAGSLMLGERVGRRELLAVGAIAAGVVLVTLAGAEHSDTSALGGDAGARARPAGAARAGAVRCCAARGVPSWSMVVGAGLAFAIGAFALKLIADALSTSEWLALVAAGARRRRDGAASA